MHFCQVHYVRCQVFADFAVFVEFAVLVVSILVSSSTPFPRLDQFPKFCFMNKLLPFDNSDRLEASSVRTSINMKQLSLQYLQHRFE